MSQNCLNDKISFLSEGERRKNLVSVTEFLQRCGLTRKKFTPFANAAGKTLKIQRSLQKQSFTTVDDRLQVIKLKSFEKFHARIESKSLRGGIERRKPEAKHVRAP